MDRNIHDTQFFQAVQENKMNVNQVLQLVYEAPLFRQGVFLTVITAAIWVLLFMLLYVRGKRLK